MAVRDKRLLRILLVIICFCYLNSIFQILSSTDSFFFVIVNTGEKMLISCKACYLIPLCIYCVNSNSF